MGQVRTEGLDVWLGWPSLCPGMQERPGQPRACALDLGKARVGVAVADELGLLAHVRPPLDGRDKKGLLAALNELVREEGVGLFIVGLPLDMSGERGPMAAKIEVLAREIQAATGVSVELFDERWTTVEASRKLRQGGVDGRRQKGLVDGVAAAVMLQSWLDRKAGTRGGEAFLEMPPAPSVDQGGDRSSRRRR
jgi:putative Holliday junction resolvase